MVSFFRSHVRFGYRGGEVGPIAAGGTMQWAPAAVAPDLVGPLLFGPEGFAGLSRRHPDVFAGSAARPLLSTLFPPVRSDILTLYLP